MFAAELIFSVMSAREIYGAARFRVENGVARASINNAILSRGKIYPSRGNARKLSRSFKFAEFADVVLYRFAIRRTLIFEMRKNASKTRLEMEFVTIISCIELTRFSFRSSRGQRGVLRESVGETRRRRSEGTGTGHRRGVSQIRGGHEGVKRPHEDPGTCQTTKFVSTHAEY